MKNRYIIRKAPPDFNHGKEPGTGHVVEFNGVCCETHRNVPWSAAG